MLCLSAAHAAGSVLPRVGAARGRVLSALAGRGRRPDAADATGTRAARPAAVARTVRLVSTYVYVCMSRGK